MADTFKQAIEFLLSDGIEGGYTDHPSDPGGKTNLGITQKELAAWRGRAVTEDDVRNLTHDEALDIYHTNYWMKCRCTDLPLGLDIAVFDCGVNQGPYRAITLLQEAVGAKVDGQFGPKTLAAVRSKHALPTLIEFCALRMRHYGSLKTFRVFGLGWSRRLMRCEAMCLAFIWDGVTDERHLGNGPEPVRPESMVQG